MVIRLACILISKKKYTYLINVGALSGKINNGYTAGLYFDVMPLCFKNFAVGFSSGYIERKTSNTFGTVNKKPHLDLEFFGVKCQYAFHITKQLFVRPNITMAYESIGLYDKRKSHYSNHHTYYVYTATENLFAVIPAVDFKYQFKKGGSIVLSAKYQVFPLLGKNYFSSPQSNEGFMFSIGWEGVIRPYHRSKYLHKYEYFHRNEYHYHNSNYHYYRYHLKHYYYPYHHRFHFN